MPRQKSLKPILKKTFNEEQLSLMKEHLDNYFMNNKDMLETIYNIVEDNASKIKLVMIDHFVTIYSKKHNIVLEQMIYGEEEYFYVHDEYKNQVKSHSKKLFDPFKRHKKITYTYDDITITTTIGQLNFMKWVLSNNLLEYIENNFDKINTEMAVYNLEKKNKSKN